MCWEKYPGCVRIILVSFQKNCKYLLRPTERVVEGYPVWPSNASLYRTLQAKHRRVFGLLPASTAYRQCRASLARGKALFFHTLRRQELDTYCRRAVLAILEFAGEGYACSLQVQNMLRDPAN